MMKMVISCGEWSLEGMNCVDGVGGAIGIGWELLEVEIEKGMFWEEKEKETRPWKWGRGRSSFCM